MFNFRFWQSIGYESEHINVTSIGEGLVINEDGSYIFNGSDNSYFEFSQVNAEVNNIYISISSTGDTPYRQYVSFDVTDEGSSLYYSLPQREVVSTVERSKYIKFNTSGVVGKLRINLEPTTNYDLGMSPTGTNTNPYGITLDSVEINKSVPFFFVPLRVLGIFFVLLLCCSLRYNTSVYRYRLNLASDKQRAVLVVLTAINILFAMFIYLNNKFYFGWDREVYTNLAQALLQGHFDLPMLKPSQELLNMANPYDTNLRDSLNVDYYWDYAFFNGKYYVYFGIVPCLILFLPLKALFDINLPVNLANFYFTIIYIIVAFRFIYDIARRCFKHISFVTFLMMAELFVFVRRLLRFFKGMIFIPFPGLPPLHLLCLALIFGLPVLIDKAM